MGVEARRYDGSLRGIDPVEAAAIYRVICGTDERAAMNVVYIDIDSLRHDHVGTYGYGGPTTPNIDALAADAVVFENAYVACSPCMPSRAGLLTGQYGIRNGVSTHGPTAQTVRSPKLDKQWFATWAEEWDKGGREYLTETRGDSREWLTLPEVFFHERVHTGAVSSFPRHTAPWFYHLWHEFLQPQEPDAEGEYMQTPRAETVADLSIDFLDRTDGPFFLYSQFWDPHAPYWRSETEVDRFRGVDLPPYPTADQIADHQEWDAWSSATQMDIEDREDLAEVIHEYDAEIRYADEHVGRVIDRLKADGIYDETLIIVTADHGEEFGEHGLYRQHWSVHEGTQHVPLIVKPPASSDITPGRRDQLVTNVDMPPTIVEFAGYEVPGSWQGDSLTPILEDSAADWRDHIVVDHGLYTAQRGVVTDRWKFIRTYHPGLWSGVVPDRQLFDLDEDPPEQEDRSSDRPEVVADLEDRMIRWAETHSGPYEDTLKMVARVGPSGYNGSKDRWSGI